MKKKLPNLVFVALLAAACSMPPVLGKTSTASNFRDGEYVGDYYDFPNSAEVKVVVEGGKIVDCVVVDYGGVLKETGAQEKIPERIIETQSTNVDAVSGATNFSRVIMNAAQKALNKAATNP